MAEHGNDYRKVLAFYMNAEKEPANQALNEAGVVSEKQGKSAA